MLNSYPFNAHYKIKRANGFTLIELLIVIVIIGLLTTAATSTYLTSQSRARDSSRKTQVNSIAGAVEAYYNVTKDFPGLVKTKDFPSNYTYPSTTYDNCQSVDPNNSDGAFIYYYFPFDNIGTDSTHASCEKRPTLVTTSGVSVYNQLDYTPFPTWIPGLSPYLNPLPIDKKYLGRTGSSNQSDNPNAFYDPLLNTISGSTTPPPSNKTQTIVYRKLSGGYAIYTRLETTNPPDGVNTVTSPPTAYNGSNIFDGTAGGISGYPLSSICNPPIPAVLTAKYIYLVCH